MVWKVAKQLTTKRLAASGSAGPRSEADILGGAAPLGRCTRAAARAEEHRKRVLPTKELRKDLVGVLLREARRHAALAIHAGLAESVVGLALLLVAQHLVRLAHLLEVLLGLLLVVGILVWVVLSSQFVVGFFDVNLTRVEL